MSKKLYYDTATGWAIGISETNETKFFSQEQAAIEVSDAVATRYTAGDAISVKAGVVSNVATKEKALATAKTALEGAANAADQQAAYVKLMMIRDGITPL